MVVTIIGTMAAIRMHIRWPRAAVAGRSFHDFRPQRSFRVHFGAVWFWKRRARKSNAFSEAPAGKSWTRAAVCENGSSIVISAKMSRLAPENSWAGPARQLLNTLIRPRTSADDGVHGPADISRRSFVLSAIQGSHD